MNTWYEINTHFTVKLTILCLLENDTSVTAKMRDEIERAEELMRNEAADISPSQHQQQETRNEGQDSSGLLDAVKLFAEKHPVLSSNSQENQDFVKQAAISLANYYMNGSEEEKQKAADIADGILQHADATDAARTATKGTPPPVSASNIRYQVPSATCIPE